MVCWFFQWIHMIPRFFSMFVGSFLKTWSTLQQLEPRHNKNKIFPNHMAPVHTYNCIGVKEKSSWRRLLSSYVCTLPFPYLEHLSVAWLTSMGVILHARYGQIVHMLVEVHLQVTGGSPLPVVHMVQWTNDWLILFFPLLLAPPPHSHIGTPKVDMASSNTNFWVNDGSISFINKQEL